MVQCGTVRCTITLVLKKHYYTRIVRCVSRVDWAYISRAIIEVYILNKGKEEEGMPQVESLTSRYARIDTRFADKNINIIAVSTSDKQVALVAEYIFNRPKDDKLIWPKIVITAPNLLSALIQVEETIGLIRGEGK